MRTSTFLLTIIIFSCFLTLSNITAQNNTPVTWHISAKPVDANVYELTFNAEIQQGWYLYSQHLTDGGPVPTTFEFEQGASIKLLKDVEEDGAIQEQYDPNFDMQIRKYASQVSFYAVVEANPETILNGTIRYMACDAEKCLPPKVETFSFNF